MMFGQLQYTLNNWDAALEGNVSLNSLFRLNSRQLFATCCCLLPFKCCLFIIKWLLVADCKVLSARCWLHVVGCRFLLVACWLLLICCDLLIVLCLLVLFLGTTLRPQTAGDACQWKIVGKKAGGERQPRLNKRNKANRSELRRAFALEEYLYMK